MHGELTLPAIGFQADSGPGARVLQRLLSAGPDFSIHGLDSVSRSRLEAYVSRSFARAYHAEINTFAPLLLELSCAGSTSAVAGIRPAGAEQLFVERYLDAPIERVLAEHFGAPARRYEVAEIANLAAVRPGACQLTLFILSAILQSAGFRYAAFAGTPQIFKILRKFNVPVHVAAVADPKCLGSEANRWGSYYASRPKVFLLDVNASLQALNHQRLSSALLDFYQPAVTELANALRSFNLQHAARD